MFDDDPRWESDPRERDDDARDRDPVDPRDAFIDKLDLPRGLERELVRDRDREYTLRGSESRTLSLIGSFRVISSRDLSDHDGRPLDPRRGDLRHLREQGLVRTIPIDGRRDVAVVLTDRGRHLLESHRRDRQSSRERDGDGPSRGPSLRDSRQQFYAELKKPREVEHDVQIYRAYEREAARLQERGARVERVVLDYELKREYVVWLATSEEKQVHLSSLAGISPEQAEHLTRSEGAGKAARGVRDRMPIGVDLAGRWVFVYVVSGDQLEDFHWFLQRHADLLGRLPAWTLRVAFPPHMASLADRYDETARSELAGLRPELVHLRWYFARRRAHTLERAPIDDQERYDHAHSGFAATRFQVLYRRWLREGETAVEAISSGAIADAIKRGAGRIDRHVLPFSYRHLSPLVGERRCTSKGAEEGEDGPARSRPPLGSSIAATDGGGERVRDATA